MKKFNFSKQKFLDLLVEQIGMKITYIACEAMSTVVFDAVADSLSHSYHRILEIEILINKKNQDYEF